MKPKIAVAFRMVMLIAAVTVCGKAVTQATVRIDNTSKYASGRYSWTVFVVADESTLSNIAYVEYTLHPSFPNPVQSIYDRGARCPFGLTSTSWGEFEVKVKIVFKKNTEPIYLKYWLNLLENHNSSSMCDTPKAKPRAARRRNH